MKLQRTTLILLLLALGLGSFVYFYEIQGATQRQEAKAQKQQIFSFTPEQVQSLTIKTGEQFLKFERTNTSNSTKWRMLSPLKTPANDAAVLYLMDLLVQGKSDRTVQVPADQLAQYGLTPPQATVTIQLNNQKTYQLLLGKPDFNRNFFYAQIEARAQKAGQVNVLLVSPNFENAVNRPLSEWQEQQDTPATDKPTSAK